MSTALPATMPPTARLAWTAAALWVARALAWALLLGGWLVLGAMGRQYTPHWAAGYAPLALWLAAIGIALTVSAHWPVTRALLRAWLFAAGIGVALALAWAARGGAAPALAFAAVAWALLLVAASRTVRALRAGQRRLPPAPLMPALAGAMLAWGMAGDLPRLPQHALALGWAVVLAAAALAALVPAHARTALGCRAGLFDCSLPAPALTHWRVIADWPLHAALLAMLPMMAALPAMADWCAVSGRPVSFVTAVHLAAMLGPPLLLRGVLVGASRRHLRIAVTALLVAGAVLLVWWPGLRGLMSASLLHGLAWSLAWATPMLEREAAPRRSSAATSDWAAAALAALAVLLLGSALARFGPPALAAMHAALAALALLAVATGAAGTAIRLVLESRR